MATYRLTVAFVWILLTKTAAAFYPLNAYYQNNPTAYIAKSFAQSNRIPGFQSSITQNNRLFPNNVYNSQQLPQSPFLPMQGTVFDQFSVCLYINLKSSVPVTQQVPMLSYFAGDPQAAHIIFQLEYERQVSSLYIGGGSGAFFPTIPRINRWIHICFTWDGSLGLVNAYVDGQGIGMSQGIQPGYQIPSNGIWRIGQPHPEGGDVTQLQVWHRVISPAEVKQVQACLLYGNILPWNPSAVEYQPGMLAFLHDEPCSQDTQVGLSQDTQSCPDYPKTSPLDRDQLDEDSQSYIIEGRFSTDLPEQKQLSFCAWVYIEESIHHPPLSIVGSDGYYVFGMIIFDDGSMGLALGTAEYEKIMFPNKKINYNDWQHYCATWSSQRGNTHVYVNGDLVHVTHGFKADYTLPAGGHLTVQQVQYGNANSDDPTKGFRLKITDINWWDHIITQEEVSQVFSCSGSLSGNIFSWNNDHLEFFDSRPEHEEKYECSVPSETSFMDVKDESFFASKKSIEFWSKHERPLPEMNSVSVCAWLFLSEEGVFTWLSGPITFGTSSEGIYLLTEDGKAWVTGVSPTVGAWTHVCLSLDGDSSIGQGTLYVDGRPAMEESGLFTSLQTKKGDAYLHQKQRNAIDENEPTEGFLSKVIDICIWNKRITPSNAAASYCGKECGNVISKASVWEPPQEKKCGIPVTKSFMDVEESPYFANPFATNFYAVLDHNISMPDSVATCQWIFLSFDEDVCNSFRISQGVYDFIDGIVESSKSWNGIYLQMGKTRWDTNVFLPQQNWTHVCVVLAASGVGKLYINGELVKEEDNIVVSKLRYSGKEYLRQVQAIPFDENEPTKGFMQKVTDFNIWSMPISDDIVHDAYCGSAMGNVINKCSSWLTVTTNDKLCTNHTNTSFMDITDARSFSNNRLMEVTSKLDHALKKLRMFSVCAWVFVSEEGCFTWLTGPINFGTCNNSIFLSTDSVQWDTGVSINLGIWAYLCASFDGKDDIGDAQLYVDGILVKKQSSLFTKLKTQKGDAYLHQMQREAFNENEPTKGFSSKVVGLCITKEWVYRMDVFDFYCGKECDYFVEKGYSWESPEVKESVSK